MKMSQEGATFIRQKVAELLQGEKFVLLIPEKGAVHIVCHDISAGEADELFRNISSQPMNPDFDT